MFLLLLVIFAVRFATIDLNDSNIPLKAVLYESDACEPTADLIAVFIDILFMVPFDIFVHYKPEHAEIIRKKMPYKWQRKKLKIITDEQAILVQGNEVDLIGKGDAAVI